ARLAQITSQYITRHALDHRIPPRESGYPFAASGVEHLAPAAGEVDDHPGATFDPVHGRIGAVSEPDFGHVLRIVVGEKSIIERHSCHGFLFEGRQAEREDLQPRWGTARRGRLRESIANEVVETIDLVAEAVALSAETIAITKSRAGKRPMLRPIHRKAAHASRRTATPACVNAVGGIQAERQCAGTSRLARLPGTAGARWICGLVHRILGARSVLVANLRLTATLEPRLPHEIARKTCHVSAALDVVVDRIAHLPRPVFVVPDENDARVALEYLRIEMQLVLTGEIDGKAHALRPLEEVPVIARPAGGCVFVGVTPRKRPLHVW